MSWNVMQLLQNFNANWNRWCYFCNQAALRKFLSASQLEGHCRHGPGPFAAYGCAHGPNTCQIWHKLGPDFVECRSLKPLDWFSPFTVLWTCLDFLLCTVIVICLFAPNGLAYGPKLVKWGSTWERMEMVQHRCHLTLIMDFQGQIYKILYLKNGKIDWHGTKWIWVDRMLHALCGFQIWPQPLHWPWISKVKFGQNASQEWDGLFTWTEKDVSR